jgi:hypothetical protein
MNAKKVAEMAERRPKVLMTGGNLKVIHVFGKWCEVEVHNVYAKKSHTT